MMRELYGSRMRWKRLHLFSKGGSLISLENWIERGLYLCPFLTRFDLWDFLHQRDSPQQHFWYGYTTIKTCNIKHTLTSYSIWSIYLL
ncbi:hypothetical protein RND71_033740 [Anisodus tanguticus]|uniref:Uncharacterized protein n=1 Tax=Anisodus tanguticus TaxID=243964 RepID=A0AAE1R8W6_9SOLA|nr:hypothetical protein RND71_033740 [Anisodus tanguticus]